MSMVGKINVWVCRKDGHPTFAVYKDDGVTPMFWKCEKCGGVADSAMHPTFDEVPKPTWEWYRPSEEELATTLGEMWRDYVSNGGLVPRRSHEPVILGGTHAVTSGIYSGAGRPKFSALNGSIFWRLDRTPVWLYVNVSGPDASGRKWKRVKDA